MYKKASFSGWIGSSGVSPANRLPVGPAPYLFIHETIHRILEILKHKGLRAAQGGIFPGIRLNDILGGLKNSGGKFENSAL